MKIRFWTCLTLSVISLGLGLLNSRLAGQMIPNAPVENFRLPMFNEEGFRAWELRGSKGTYMEGDQVALDELIIRLYTGDATNGVRTEITSPDATVLIAENKAVGTNGILIKGDNFRITGQNWTWQGDDHQVVIEENVVVTFFQGIGDILK
jgi:hypothetical protein